VQTGPLPRAELFGLKREHSRLLCVDLALLVELPGLNLEHRRLVADFQ